MTPSEGRLLVEKVQPTSKFEIAGDGEYIVVSSKSKAFEKGARVLFTDSRTYKYRGKEYIVVREEDIEASDAN